jgi:hypothetical protein
MGSLLVPPILRCARRLVARRSNAGSSEKRRAPLEFAVREAPRPADPLL